MSNVIVNSKGEEQKDKFGEPILFGQPVLIMDVVHSKGSRGSVSTGIAVGFDRQVVILIDTRNNLVSTGTAISYIDFYSDRMDKKLKAQWLSDWDERDRRGLTRDECQTVSSQHVIGCNEEVRRGFRDGSLFRG